MIAQLSKVAGNCETASWVGRFASCAVTVSLVIAGAMSPARANDSPSDVSAPKQTEQPRPADPYAAACADNSPDHVVDIPRIDTRRAELNNQLQAVQRQIGYAQSWYQQQMDELAAKRPALEASLARARETSKWAQLQVDADRQNLAKNAQSLQAGSLSMPDFQDMLAKDRKLRADLQKDQEKLDEANRAVRKTQADWAQLSISVSAVDQVKRDQDARYQRAVDCINTRTAEHQGDQIKDALSNTQTDLGDATTRLGAVRGPSRIDRIGTEKIGDRITDPTRTGVPDVPTDQPTRITTMPPGIPSAEDIEDAQFVDNACENAVSVVAAGQNVSDFLDSMRVRIDMIQAAARSRLKAAIEQLDRAQANYNAVLVSARTVAGANRRPPDVMTSASYEGNLVARNLGLNAAEAQLELAKVAFQGEQVRTATIDAAASTALRCIDQWKKAAGGSNSSEHSSSPDGQSGGSMTASNTPTDQPVSDPPARQEGPPPLPPVDIATLAGGVVTALPPAVPQQPQRPGGDTPVPAACVDKYNKLHALDVALERLEDEVRYVPGIPDQGLQYLLNEVVGKELADLRASPGRIEHDWEKQKAADEEHAKRIQELEKQEAELIERLRQVRDRQTAVMQQRSTAEADYSNCLRSASLGTPPPNGAAGAPPNPQPPATPASAPPSAGANGCANAGKRYACTYMAVDPHGASSSFAYEMDVCVPPSGNWSQAYCTIDSTRMDHVYAGATKADSRDTCSPYAPTNLYHDEQSFQTWCKSQFNGRLLVPELPSARHADVASLSTADVAVASNKPASQPTTDVAVGSDKPASKPTTDVALGSPTSPKQPEPEPQYPGLPGPSPEPASGPAPSQSGGIATPQINIYIPPASGPGPGPSHPGPATPPANPPDHGPPNKTADPSNLPPNQPSPQPNQPQSGGGARINSCGIVNGHVTCGPQAPSNAPTPSPSPGPTQTNKPIIDTRTLPLPVKPLPVRPVTPSANGSEKKKVAALPLTPVKPTGNASTAGKQPAALPPAPVQPSSNASAGGKKPAPLPVASVAPALPPPPLPQKQANVSPPPVQPACRGEGVTFRPDQSESKTMHRTIVGGAACIHRLNDRGVMFTGVSIATMPSHGTLAKTGEYEHTYRPHPGYKGSDRYAIKVCGQSNAGSGCSTLTYVVTVE